MQKWINQIWYQGHWARWLLLPLSVLFALISSIRRLLFKLGFKNITKLPVPVVVVGNITAGGSGKTPTVIYLINLLRANGLKPGVVSRGYGANIDGVISVTQSSKAVDVGDEPLMIVNRTHVPMVVGSQRVLAAQKLLADFDVDVIICDDGLQHYALGRDIEIALVDGARRYGNQCLLPAGPLREGLWRLDNIDWIINNGGPLLTKSQGPEEQLMQLVPAPLCRVNTQLFDKTLVADLFDTEASIIEQPIVAIAGIGNPQRFFDSLIQQGYQLKQTVAFADHQAYDQQRLIALSTQTTLLMTEKDAVKCRDFALQNWWYMPVNAKLSEQFDIQFMSRVTQLIQLKKEI
ncbi:tetraacyldisaccharide 4'-kinase [Shewanella glacialimarina]|uniref:tetraacyldisaccharide 4'-kinase n=1 Tax=Shewanella glacialimarina TaxID=2590884 RepID=UPI001CF8FC65|nr:tetraacyldisaccharide 4'-kinase [Shewanella glacialimarina]UCX04613.1 tetraacyldisaccharide 4'-kinase [Shewanella glacialimarina]